MDLQWIFKNEEQVDRTTHLYTTHVTAPELEGGKDTVLIIAAALVNLRILQRTEMLQNHCGNLSKRLVCREVKLRWNLLGTIY